MNIFTKIFRRIVNMPLEAPRITVEGVLTPTPSVSIPSVEKPLKACLLKAAMPRIIVDVWQQPLTDACNEFNITNDRLAMFLAQIGHESDDCRTLKENLNYTSPERLMQVWPSRFPTIESAIPYVRNPIGLANNVYGMRMGNVIPSDGSKYIGRGLIQLTGKNNYMACGDALGIDLVHSPELLESPIIAARSAAWYFSTRTQGTDIRGVTRAINGGLHGLEDREKRFKSALNIIRGT